MKRFSDRKICSMQALDLAKLAIGRILFSDKSGAVKLLLSNSEEVNKKSLNNEDMLAVSDIRRNKDGSIDVKMYDIIKAAELMIEIGKEENNNQESGADFLEGFLKSAKQLSTLQDNENENNQQSENYLPDKEEEFD